jgi:putative redox protein
MSSPTSEAPTGATAPKPVVSNSAVTWRGDRSFEAGPVGRTHLIDAGAKVAPGPVETLLNAIATCSGTDILDIIAKRKTPVERMSVVVSAVRRADFPRRVEKLDMEFVIDGVGIEREHAERAIQLSFEKYCSVAASLAPDIETNASLTLNGEKFPAVRQKVWTPPV